MMASDLLNFWIVCTLAETPAPQSLVEAVRQAGHHAELIAVRHSLLTALGIEIAMGNNASRVMIDISEDFQKGIDLSTSDWEIVQDMLEPQEAATIRRLVQVSAWSHADALAVQTLVDTLCSTMGGRLSEWQA